MTRFESGSHMFNYARRMFWNSGRELPLGEEKFERLCLAVYESADEFYGETDNDKNFIIVRFDQSLTYKCSLMLREEADLISIEEFIKTYINQLIKLEKYIKGEEKPEGIDFDFIANYFAKELKPIETWGKEYSENFLADFKKYARVYGVYFIYGEQKELLYVGKSKNLFERLSNSLREKKGAYYSFAVTDTNADSHLYEIYYISKLKPSMNKDSVEEDGLTVTLPDLNISELKPAYKG